MEEVFRISKKTLRLPVKMGEEVGMKELLEDMRDEMREELKGMRKEIRKVVEGQKEIMSTEVERIKALREREEKWQRKKGEMVETLKVL
ncbi:hypothetical protein ALC57_16439 [Trachymyrmex cornetzi]|uniref:Uncharacterized protein n=1 Tax=Trachymyrmex cornetzi TaxID=471704 RepID=A0A151IV56_9HYME|nr:hypothetical protein ALC57_16439 [Trachymyrmex cornetzi]